MITNDDGTEIGPDDDDECDCEYCSSLPEDFTYSISEIIDDFGPCSLEMEKAQRILASAPLLLLDTKVKH